jgi:hypothetical protein
MADLPHTICFRASTWMRDRLRELADQDRRKLGDVIRLLVEIGLKEKDAIPRSEIRDR